MTVAEVVIATFILLLGIMATFQLFDAATRNTFRLSRARWPSTAPSASSRSCAGSSTTSWR